MITNVIDLLTLHEGYRSKPYRDTLGYLTVGIGRNLDTRGISRDEAQYMLKNDIVMAEYLLAMHPFWNSLSMVRKAVLLDMMVNIGPSRFNGFKRTLEFIRNKDYLAASKEMLVSKWAQQVGQRATRLSRMMETNEWPKE